jgi:hypothetical protein
MKIQFLFCFCLFTISSFCQNNSILIYRSALISFSNNFASNVIDEDKWDNEERRMKSIIKDAESDLQSGSGLSFQEMNDLRRIKKYIDALYIVGKSINPSNSAHFNKRSLNYVLEIVPHSKFEYQFSELDVDVFRLKIEDYCVFLFYYSDGSFTGRKIGWKKLNESACGTLMGNLTVLSGVYKQFWNNSNCILKSTFKFKVIENTYLMDLSNMKSIYFDIPYTD